VNFTARQWFAISFVVSVLAALGASAISDTIIGGEGHDGYLELAQNLVAGNGYVFQKGGHKVFHRPPLYPVLLMPGAALSKTFARAYIIILNSTLLAGTVTIVFSFGVRFFSRRIGTCAAALLLLNPFMLYGVKNPMSAICQMFFFSAVLFLTWRLLSTKKPPSFQFLILYTAVLAAAALGHATVLLLDCLILCVVAFRWRVAAVVCSLGLLILVAPWTWRNYRVTGMFIPVAGNAGLAYFAGNAHWGITLPPQAAQEAREDAEFRHAGLPLEKRREWMKYYGFTDPKVDALANERAKAHARNHPGEFAKKFFLNALEYYFPVTFAFFAPEGGPVHELPFPSRITAVSKEALALSVYHLALICCAIVGFARARKMFVAKFLLAMWIVYALPYFPFLTFVGHALYTYGTLPIIALLAAIPLARFTGEANPPATN
jgi:4-amino-4-deoxy-L-arabinose transferase-like glycosyltransferase